METKVTILGYVQRGGSPNISDRIMATNLGAQGVLALEEAKGALAMGFKNNRAQVFDLEEALAVEKTFSQTLYQELQMVSI
ncbi:putative 6-phosphofructokinase [Peptoniphilus sp. oral taxon 375 str. F0436]|nr:putative 6-phosphofructokinase [Peptoniphilus sp. oral taxon 375 str. F0436]